LLSVCSGTRVLSRSGGRLRQNATSPSPARIESRRTPCASRVPEGASRCARTPPGVPRPARATELGEVREAPHTRTATELAAAFLGEPRPGPSRTARLDTRPLSRGAPGRNGRVSACKGVGGGPHFHGIRQGQAGARAEPDGGIDPAPLDQPLDVAAV
jgi:hypothetical protein